MLGAALIVAMAVADAGLIFWAHRQAARRRALRRLVDDQELRMAMMRENAAAIAAAMAAARISADTAYALAHGGIDLADAGSDRTVITFNIGNDMRARSCHWQWGRAFSDRLSFPIAMPLAPGPAPGAVKRSMDLLKDWLSAPQLERFGRDGTFEVVGDHTGKRYRITPPGPYSIHELDEAGRVIRHLCVEPRPESPLRPFSAGDIMLAQKIALETDEMRTLAIANFRLPVDRAIYHHAILRADYIPTEDGPTT